MSSHPQTVRRLALLCLVAALTSLASATNAVPWINTPLSKSAVAAGGPAFTLNIYGFGFSSTSKVLWNGNKRDITYYSQYFIALSVKASDIAAPGTVSLQVENDTPGGGYSNVVYLPIGSSKTSLTGVFSSAAGGTGSGWPAVGDFNGDGKLDVAAVNTSANAVSIFLGNGDGTFKTHVDYAAGTGPAYVVTGDFNDDGKLDLAVANPSTNNISVLLGNGDGTFGSPISSAAGNSPVALAVADFNHDGKLDVVVPNPPDNTVSVLLGNGDGTFGSPIASATDTDPVHVAVADFDLDGKMDVVTANQNCVNSVCGVGTISVLRGEANGSFHAPNNFQADYGTSFVAAASFLTNGQAADVIAVNSSAFGSNGTVSYFENRGRGVFNTQVEYETGANPTAVAIGDFNDDGFIDIATLNSGAANLYFLFGNGSGTFGGGTTTSNFNLSGTPVGLVAADFNNDGQLDFASSDSSGNQLDILTQQQAPAGATLNKSSIYFGVQAVNRVSPSQKVTLTNSGGAALAISSITVSPTQFLQSSNCPSSLAGGLSCTISVAFDPSAVTSYSGTLTVNDNAANTPQTVALSGVGTFTVYSTYSLNFGNVAVGGTSSLPITLTNLSQNSIKITGVSIHGTGDRQFTQTNTCGGSVAGKGTCTFTVTFAPTFTGTRSATLTINTNSSPSTNIPLTGTGD
jgi:hypothetical protein